MPVMTKFNTPPKRKPDMATIYVKTKEGRMAFYEGKPIPHDKFVPVRDDPYMRRLVHHWEDLELQGGSEGKPAQAKSAGKQEPVGGQSQPTGRQAEGTGAPSPRN